MIIPDQVGSYLDSFVFRCTVRAFSPFDAGAIVPAAAPVITPQSLINNVIMLLSPTYSLPFPSPPGTRHIQARDQDQ